MPTLETPGYLQASLGRSPVGSLLHSPGSWCTGFCLYPQESISPSCVSSGSSVVGLMVTSFKRVYAILMSATPRAPVPVAVHCWPVPPQEILRHSSVSVSVRSLGPGEHKVCLSPLGVSDRNRVSLWMQIHPSYLAGVSLTLDVGYLLIASPAKHIHCCWISVFGVSSWLLLLTLDMGYLLSATPAAPALLNCSSLLL